MRGCPRKIEATVKAWVEQQALRHLQSHVNRKAKQAKINATLKETIAAVESDKSALLIA